MPYFKINKIDATDSTNSLLRERYLEKKCSDGDVLWSNIQNRGRGQRNTVWQSESGKNLTFSVYVSLESLTLQNPFLLSCIVSLAIQETLKFYKLPKLKVKWPNDIMSGNKKVCGLLIENMFKGTKIQGSIIGIGLNVNQLEFKNLPSAVSMAQISGIQYELDEVLNTCLEFLKQKLEVLKQQESYILKLYETQLYRLGMTSTFESNGSLFSGIIRGVSLKGLLKVQIENDQIVSFDLKTIKLKN